MKLGILTCSSITRDLACSSFNCLRDLHDGKGAFSVHNGTSRLVGIIDCAGCMTLTAPDKLLKRIRSLTELKPDAIHLSTCMISHCPFKDKFYDILSQNFPDIPFIKGTHGWPDGLSESEHKAVHKGVIRDLVKRGQTMADMIPVLYHQDS